MDIDTALLLAKIISNRFSQLLHFQWLILFVFIYFSYKICFPFSHMHHIPGQDFSGTLKRLKTGKFVRILLFWSFRGYTVIAGKQTNP